MCGSVATYNNKTPTPGPRNLWQLLVKTARLEGYLVSAYLSQWPEARIKLAQWLDEDRIRFREHIDRGLESAPVSFLRLFNGDHDGKLIVDISGTP
jgi:NADPH-dependent curcumin reductase CurA